MTCSLCSGCTFLEKQIRKKRGEKTFTRSRSKWLLAPTKVLHVTIRKNKNKVGLHSCVIFQVARFDLSGNNQRWQENISLSARCCCLLFELIPGPSFCVFADSQQSGSPSNNEPGKNPLPGMYTASHPPSCHQSIVFCAAFQLYSSLSTL